jgi:hypothetical protein
VAKKPVVSANSRSYLGDHPSWRFGRLRTEPPFGWSNISRAEARAIVSHLAALEKMTWNDILVVARKQNHFCDVSELSKEARTNIESNWQDAEQLLSIRLTNLKRVWGVMDQGILYLLWWDPEHQVYRSTFKDRFS